MGLDTYLDFYVGVPAELTVPGKSKQIRKPVKRFHEETGQEYEKQISYWAITTSTGVEIKLRDQWSTNEAIQDYFEKLGLEYGCGCGALPGIIGKKVGHGDSCDNVQTMTLPVPNDDEVSSATEKVQEILKNNNFSVDIINAVKCYAVVSPSY